MKSVVGACFLLVIGSLVGCADNRRDPAFYKPVKVTQRAENVFVFSPAHHPSSLQSGIAASAVWEEFAAWAEKHKEKYRAISVCPAYGSCLIVTVEDISPPDAPPDLLPKK